MTRILIFLLGNHLRVDKGLAIDISKTMETPKDLMIDGAVKGISQLILQYTV